MYHFILVVFLVVLAGCSQVQTPAGPVEKEVPADALHAQQTVPTYEVEPFNIEAIGLSSLPVNTWQRQAIDRAIEKWEDVIVEGLPDVGTIDDIRIMFEWSTTSTRLASAYIGSVRGGRLGLPYYATITISSIMSNTYYDKDDWENVVLHEIGHALGFSWALTNSVGTSSIMGNRFFNGTHAAEGYRQILSLKGEQLANAIPDLRVPLQPDLWDNHWKYPALQWDIMNPYYHFWAEAVLTKVTIGAMRDFGYTVDMTQADDPPVTLAKSSVTPRGIHAVCDGEHIITP